MVPLDSEALGLMTIEEALVDLYRGTVNVKKTADALEMELETLQRLFREYVKRTPIDESVWQGDILISWPYSGN